MTRPLRRFGNIFVAGLLAALPLAATVFIVVWTVQTLYAWLGPGSAVGGLLARLGLGLGASEVAGYLLGLACVLALVFLLGLLVHTRLHGWLVAGIDTLVQQVPLVRNIYDLLRRFVDLVSQRDATGTGAMSPVWLYFGGRDGGGAAVLGLLSHAEPVLMRGQPYLGVLVSTAPVPVGGALVYVPQDWVEPAPVGVEGLTSIYVSMGVTAGQHLAARPPAA
ncbi:MAG: DUF502 domain-containing protein [Rubrivivax sp.]